MDPLREFFSWWDIVTIEDAIAAKRCLSRARREEDMQEFLAARPHLLIQHLSGGHGRWVIPKKRLGSEYVTDFLVGERDSLGFHWQAVELESPKASMFNQNGDPSRTLVHAIRQILDWRAWLQQNCNYAARERGQSGLGLTDICATIPGLIVIGRRKDVSPETNALRRQLQNNTNIKIHSYDWLLPLARTKPTLAPISSS